MLILYENINYLTCDIGIEHIFRLCYIRV